MTVEELEELRDYVGEEASYGRTEYAEAFPYSKFEELVNELIELKEEREHLLDRMRSESIDVDDMY